MKRTHKRVLSLTLCALLLLALVPVKAQAASNPAEYVFDVSEGNITISNAGGGNLTVAYGASETATVPGAQNITIIGTTTAYGVSVSTGVTANITLSGVNIHSH